MNNDGLDLFEEVDLSDIENLGDVCTDVSASASVNGLDRKPLKARQKLEIYWERKRLAENLYDVLVNDDIADASNTFRAKLHRMPAVADSAAMTYEIRP